MKRSTQEWIKFTTTRLLGMLVDTAILAFAYVAAFALRFDFQRPRWGWRVVALSFITVWVVHIAALVLCGCYRVAWRRFTLDDLRRYLRATLISAFVLTLLRMCMGVDSLSHVRPPYSITLICFALATLGLVGWRIIWSWSFLASIKVDSLLERDIKRLCSKEAIDFLSGKVVMVTGAGGSIGSEIVRQVVLAAPKLLLMVERSENALYEIDRELRQQGVNVPIKPLMVDINDLERMEDVFNFYRPEIVLHAAAYKHVPMVEMNPREGERNNTEATRNLAEIAKRHQVRRFVLISTDKAVNPVSVMGKTKLAAEKAIMAMNGEDSSTSFCAVRFGNVFGSSGSVVPLFKEQIARHLPITVTHPDMKRYFMTVQEAVGLVLQAASRKEKAIYTLDMGEPIRILDLAEGMIRQAGYKPYVDIPIIFTGIRPGEKLFEELDVSENSAYKTDMARIYITK